jgi:hypothetical protein
MDHDGLAAALKHNSELAVKANTLEHQPHLFTIPGIDRKRFMAFKGEITERQIDPPKRVHHAHDLDAFVELVQCFAKGTAPLSDGYLPEVWHGNDGNGKDVVKATLDATWRDQYVRYELPITTACDAIGTLGDKCWPQQDLISELKNNLSGTGLDDALLLQIKSVNFVKNEQAASEIGDRGHSFGTQVERKVLGISESFPEQVLARFAWWNIGPQVLPKNAPRPIESDPSELPNSHRLDSIVAVRVNIEIDFTKKGFWLRPLADDLERAEQHVQRALHEWLLAELADASVPIFHGV